MSFLGLRFGVDMWWSIRITLGRIGVSLNALEDSCRFPDGPFGYVSKGCIKVSLQLPGATDPKMQMQMACERISEVLSFLVFPRTFPGGTEEMRKHDR